MRVQDTATRPRRPTGPERSIFQDKWVRSTVPPYSIIRSTVLVLWSYHEFTLVPSRPCECTSTRVVCTQYTHLLSIYRRSWYGGTGGTSTEVAVGKVQRQASSCYIEGRCKKNTKNSFDRDEVQRMGRSQDGKSVGIEQQSCHNTFSKQ